VTLRYCNGDIFASNAEALVDPVNCVGTSGKGLALLFKHRHPDAVGVYERDAKAGAIRTGDVYAVWSRARLIDRGPNKRTATLIYFFPTKQHWRDPSRLEWIASGLDALVRRISGVESIAIPALGCGCGGLRWDDVRPLIEQAAERMSGVDVMGYPPQKSARRLR
jgi:O-acetyl-ADP-ribose deacetylase (regulator of RNase III)